jgi:hypothetical protein
VIDTFEGGLDLIWRVHLERKQVQIFLHGVRYSAISRSVFLWDFCVKPFVNDIAFGLVTGLAM